MKVCLDVKKVMLSCVLSAALVSGSAISCMAGSVNDEYLVNESYTESSEYDLSDSNYEMNFDYSISDNSMSVVDEVSVSEGEQEDQGELSGDVSKSFTDPNMLAVVRQTMGIDDSTPITSRMCDSVVSLDFSGVSLKSINGLENFRNVKTLNLQNTEFGREGFNIEKYPNLKKTLEVLDVSHCKISKINIKGMSRLKQIILTQDAIFDLNLKGCNRLEQVAADSSSLSDIVHLPKSIKVLNLNYTCVNSDSVPLKRLPNLEYLLCRGTSVSDLHVTNAKNLKYLECGESVLEGLEVSNCPKLDSLCVDSAYSMDMLTVKNCDNLKSIECSDSEYLRELEVSKCPNLTTILASDCSLRYLTVKKCKNLNLLYCQNNKLRKLDLTSCPKMGDLDCSNNYIPSVKSVKGISEELKNNSARFIFGTQKKLKANKESLSTSKYTLKPGSKGNTIKIKDKIRYAKHTFKSSNKKVATVDSRGRIKVKNPGRTTITIRSDGGNKYKVKTMKAQILVTDKIFKNVTGIKAKKRSNGNVAVSWKKTSGATGYLVQYSRGKDFSTVLSGEVKKGNSFTITDMKKSKNVYVRVLAYQTKKGFTYYGKWSEGVKAK